MKLAVVLTLFAPGGGLVSPLAPMLASSRSAARGGPVSSLAPAVASGRKEQLPVERRLHNIARSATIRDDYEAAARAHKLAVRAFGSGRSFLLAALFYADKLVDEQAARSLFSDGVVRNRDDAALVQAWGLFESKQGKAKRARQLVQRAVVLDPRLSGVLRWRQFSAGEDEAGGRGPAAPRQGRQPARAGAVESAGRRGDAEGTGFA